MFLIILTVLDGDSTRGYYILIFKDCWGTGYSGTPALVKLTRV